MEPSRRREDTKRSEVIKRAGMKLPENRLTAVTWFACLPDGCQIDNR